MYLFSRFLFLLESVSPTIASSVLGSGGTAAVVDAAEDILDVAEEAPPGGFLSSPLMIVVMYAVIIGAMYLILFRPQRKREKRAKEMQAAIKAGDNVITSGGFYGRVADVGEDCFIVEFGTNRGVRIPVQKSDVVGIKAPTLTPVPKES